MGILGSCPYPHANCRDFGMKKPPVLRPGVAPDYWSGVSASDRLSMRTCSQRSISASNQHTLHWPRRMRFGKAPAASNRAMCWREYGTIALSSFQLMHLIARLLWLWSIAMSKGMIIQLVLRSVHLLEHSGETLSSNIFPTGKVLRTASNNLLANWRQQSCATVSSGHHVHVCYWLNFCLGALPAV